METVHPHTLGLVAATAALVELSLQPAPRAAHRPARRATPRLELAVLGRDRADVRLDGEPVHVSLRHSELLVLLAEQPAGLTAEQLALRLHGDDGKPVTARAEISRLRRTLPGCVEADPYRLAADVESDAGALRAQLRDGSVAEALAGYGTVLPRSESPGVAELRDELEGWARRAALAGDDAEILWAVAADARGRGRPPGLEAVPRGAPRHGRSPRARRAAARAAARLAHPIRMMRPAVGATTIGVLVLLLSSLVVLVVANAVTIGAMLLVRRRAPEGSYFTDGDRASGVFGVLAGGFAIFAGFIIFLAFTTYDESRAGGETEALSVVQQFETAEFLPPATRDRLSGEIACYARSVVHQEWPAMERGEGGDTINPWALALFRSMKASDPRTAGEQAAYSKWLDQTSDREAARNDRLHGAEGIIPSTIWIVLILIALVVFAYMLFFADPSGGRCSRRRC